MDNEIEQIVQALLNGESISELLKDFKPKSRTETYLKSALMKTKIEDLPNPQSRLDVLIMLLNDTIHKEYSTKFDEGYSYGHEVGLDAGRTEGYDDGYSEGNAAGYETGHTEGYNTGHDVGYSEGTEAGKQTEYDAFWDSLQDYGNRNGYQCAFGALWTKETFKPKYDIKPTGNCYMIFAYCKAVEDLVAIQDELGIEIDLSQTVGLQYAFSNNTTIKRIGTLGATSTLMGVVAYASNLETIEKIIIYQGMQTNNGLSTMFDGCSRLQHVNVIEGEILYSISLNACKLLTAKSARNFLKALANFAGTDKESVYKITLHSDVWTRVEDTTAEDYEAPPSEATWKEYAQTKGWNI